MEKSRIPLLHLQVKKTYSLPSYNSLNNMMLNNINQSVPDG